jgi:hypothetical protein
MIYTIHSPLYHTYLVGYVAIEPSSLLCPYEHDPRSLPIWILFANITIV